MISETFLESLSPIEIQYLSERVLSILKLKVKPDTSNEENLNKEVKQCPHCHSSKIIRYGLSRGRQRFKCKECGKTFSSTTGTVFFHSQISYQDWASFIAAEIIGTSLRNEMVLLGRSLNTVFCMRHKLYSLTSSYNNRILSGLIEFDPVYTKINLKGTKPGNMPRLSKKRGSHKASSSGKNLRGLSHHKICLISAVDEKDSFLLKIAGLGQESCEKFLPFRKQFRKGSTLVCDEKTSTVLFCEKCHLQTDVIINKPGKKVYLSLKGNSLSSINQLHQQLSELIREKHGVSTRHLQNYLDWMVFLKNLTYQTDKKHQKTTAYMKLMNNRCRLKSRSICSKPMPISLYEAYGEYRYGIYKEQYS